MLTGRSNSKQRDHDVLGALSGGQTSPTRLPSATWLGFAQARRDPYVEERGGRVQCHIDWRSSASNRGLPKRDCARSATNRVSWRGAMRSSDDVDQTESVRLFVCLVIDAIYRDRNFAGVRHLWDLMVASNGQHSVLFGATCRESDVLVIMHLLLIIYVRYMLHVISCYILFV